MINEEKLTFEESLNKAGFGIYSYKITGLVGLIIMGLVCISFGSSIIVPTSACELKTNSFQRGILAAMPIVGLIFGGTFWGYLADTYGRRRMLLISLTSAAIVNIIASISVNWIMLMVLQLIATTLSSGQYPLSMTIVSESVPLEKRNIVILIATSIFQAAQGIMAVVALPISSLSFSYYFPFLGIYWNSWRTLVLIYSLPSVVAAIWLYFMYESPKFLFANGREAEALAILKKIHQINRKTSEDFQVTSVLLPSSENKPTKSILAKNQILPVFKPPLLKTTAILTTLFVFQTVTAFKIWLPTIANQFMKILDTGEGMNLTLCDIIRISHYAPKHPDANPCSLNSTAMIIVLLVGITQSFMNILLSLVVDRIGRRNLSIIITALCGFSGILVNLVSNAVGSAVLFFILLMGLVTMGIYTAMTVTFYPTNLRAFATTVVLTGNRIGIILSVQLLNYLIEYNCEVGFNVFASIFASSAILAAFLPNKSNSKTVTEVDSKT